jgi:hypothetical protein
MSSLTMPNIVIGKRRGPKPVTRPSPAGSEWRRFRWLPKRLAVVLTALFVLAVAFTPSAVALQPLRPQAAHLVAAERALTWASLHTPLPQPDWVPVGQPPRFEPVPFVDFPLRMNHATTGAGSNAVAFGHQARTCPSC